LPRFLISVCMRSVCLYLRHNSVFSLLFHSLAHQFHQSQNAEEPEKAERL
jgi:hypothetical protein